MPPDSVSIIHTIEHESVDEHKNETKKKKCQIGW